MYLFFSNKSTSLVSTFLHLFDPKVWTATSVNVCQTDAKQSIWTTSVYINDITNMNTCENVISSKLMWNIKMVYVGPTWTTHVEFFLSFVNRVDFDTQQQQMLMSFRLVWNHSMWKHHTQKSHPDFGGCLSYGFSYVWPISWQSFLFKKKSVSLKLKK